jgi:hypothetical protein
MRRGRIPGSPVGLAVVALVVGTCLSAPIGAAAAPTTKCTAEGSVKLSPGLSETPAVQQIQIAGKLSNCAGEETTYTAAGFRIHEKTEQRVTCAALKSGAVSAAGTIQITWTPRPKKGHTSLGSAALSLVEGTAALSGSIAHWAFGEGELQGSLAETYAGGESCGTGKKVKKGTVAGTVSVVG